MPVRFKVAYLFIVFCLILLWSTLFFVNSSDAYIWCRFSESLALLDLSDMLPLDFIGEYLLLIFSSSELLSSEDELLVDFGFTSGCFDLLVTGVSSSELLSSEELDSFTVGF